MDGLENKGIAWSQRPSSAVSDKQAGRHDGLVPVKAVKRIKPVPIADLTAAERDGLRTVVGDERRANGVMFSNEDVPVARGVLDGLSAKGHLTAMGGGRVGGKHKYVYRYTVKPVSVAMLKDYEWCLKGMA